MSQDTTSALDVVVLGAGPVGENVAERTAAGGLRTVIVESELVGGECSYWACMPSKALLRPPSALQGAQSVPGARQAVTDNLDAPGVLGNRDTFAAHWSDDSQVEWLESAGIELLRGRARLTGPRRLSVTQPEGTQQTLRPTQAVVVCTGSDPVIPDVPGLSTIGPWTNRDGTSAGSVPGTLAVIGGGPVGIELAAAWAALGSRVHLLVRGSRLLSSAEPFVGGLVETGLARYGVDVRLRSQATSASHADDGSVLLELDSGDTLQVDEVLVATGRTPGRSTSAW